jgi:hypothetical protein
MSPLSAVAFDFSDGHALDTYGIELVFDLIYFKRPDDDLNLFHLHFTPANS